MNMTYRCKSCGSNATASLTCDYCGAGTTTRHTRKKQHNVFHNPPNDGLLIFAASLIGLVLTLLAFIADNVQGGVQ